MAYRLSLIAYRENPRQSIHPQSQLLPLTGKHTDWLLVMPLRLTSAPVSGFQKKRKSAITSRPRSSPFANHPRTKPRASIKDNDLKDDGDGFSEDQDELPDLGLSRYIPETAPVEDVPQALRYIRTSMFEDIPAARAGMNSTRIAEVLNLRRSLPPLASVAHVHTLLDTPTRTEREIVELVNTGRVRRLIVPGRGNDAAGLGDCLVLAEDWEGLVRGSSGLEEAVKGLFYLISTTHSFCRCLVLTDRPSLTEKFLQVLNSIGTSSAIPPGVFTAIEYQALVRAGFLVSSSSLAKSSLSVTSLPNLSSSSSTTTPASRAGLDHDMNNNNDNDTKTTTTNTTAHDNTRFHTATLFLSLPNTGPYLRLLSAGRSHLMTLLKRSPQREAPLYLLRDRWDGAIETDKSFHVAKRVRGEYAGILPGRTKKWKELYGMSFRWVLEEAIGAGLVEVFDTGSVGPGVRCL